jgi:hypothetical protein
MKGTQHFAASFRRMRTQILEVLGGLSQPHLQDGWMQASL